MAVKPIPEGYQSVTPYLIVEGAAELIDFVQEAFGAEQRFRMDTPDGSVAHAEVTIGDSVVMTADASEEWPAKPGALHLYVEDCDTVFRRAVAAGATEIQEPRNEFYGDRSGCVRDPAGNIWWVVTHVEDVPEDEMAQRAEAWAAQQPR
jgi:PhnB protein